MLSKRDCLRKIKKPADVAPLPSAKKICPVMTPIDLDELIKLYILQKNYHEIPDQIAYNGITHKQVFQKYYEDLCDKHGVILNVDPCLAPAMFTSQPNIPFILFNTAAGQRRGKQPLIIHTHGGPHVYIPPDLYHAEIAYFLSQGFVVACPNYRGSSGYSPAHTPPAEWIKLQEDFENIDYEITGPEDVYTVAVYMSKKHGIDPNKIFLRGGSFGSFINAQLLKQIDQKKFKNIFCGVHLSGGVSYPAASSLPVDIPILITHGLRDPIASCDKAFVFMDNMLLFRELYLTQDLSGQQVETFIAETGNHHLIDPRLEIDDLNFYFSVKKLQQVMMAMAHHKVIKQSIKCQSPLEELERYLSLSTGFITGLLNGTYQFTPLHDQVIALAAYRDPQVDPELAMQATERKEVAFKNLFILLSSFMFISYHLHSIDELA